MIHYEFTVYEDGINQFKKENMDPALVNRIEGKLDILRNSTVFISEENVSLLELGIQLEHWLIRMKKGTMENFRYHCVDWDDDEGIILEFLKTNSGLWEVDSVWKNTESRLSVVLDELTAFATSFVERLKAELIGKHAINWEACLQYEMKNAIYKNR